MDRRQAIAGLVAICGAAATVRLEAIDPADVIVIEVPGNITREQADAIRFAIDRAWGPGYKAIVLANGARFGLERHG